MSDFTREISIRWADLDPNFHVRHSAYYDYGAQHRIEILEREGLTMKVMQQGISDQLFSGRNVYSEKKCIWAIRFSSARKWEK